MIFNNAAPTERRAAGAFIRLCLAKAQLLFGEEIEGFNASAYTTVCFITFLDDHRQLVSALLQVARVKKELTRQGIVTDAVRKLFRKGPAIYCCCKLAIDLYVDRPKALAEKSI